MKIPKPRKHTRMLAFLLPGMALFALAAYIVLGAIPGALLTGDYIAALAQVPVLSVHAFAAIACAWLFGRWTFRDLDDADEAALMRLIKTNTGFGGGPALQMLCLDAARQLVPLIAFLVFFYPAR